MKSLAKKLILALLCLGMGWSLSAQTTITGVVTDEEGEPLIGAGVLIQGTTIGTVTGIDGDYTLTVPADATHLVFSFIGLSDQVIAIEGKTRIDVVLKVAVHGDRAISKVLARVQPRKRGVILAAVESEVKPGKNSVLFRQRADLVPGSVF